MGVGSGTYAHFTSSPRIHALGARPYFTRVVLTRGSRLEHVCTLRHLKRSLKRRGASSCDDDVSGRRTQSHPHVMFKPERERGGAGGPEQGGNDKVFSAYALTELSHDIIYMLHIPPPYTAYLLYVNRL